MYSVQLKLCLFLCALELLVARTEGQNQCLHRVRVTTSTGNYTYSRISQTATLRPTYQIDDQRTVTPASYQFISYDSVFHNWVVSDSEEYSNDAHGGMTAMGRGPNISIQSVNGYATLCPYDDDDWYDARSFTPAPDVHISGILECDTSHTSTTYAYWINETNRAVRSNSSFSLDDNVIGTATITACEDDTVIYPIQPPGDPIDNSHSHDCSDLGIETYTVRYSVRLPVIFDIGHYDFNSPANQNIQINTSCTPDTTPSTTSTATTATPTTSESSSSSPSPTMQPTRPSCNDSNSGCDQTEFGVCEQNVGGIYCSCVSTHYCEPSCNTPNHRCVLNTASPATSQPSQVPSSVPTSKPTFIPTANPTSNPSVSPSTSMAPMNSASDGSSSDISLIIIVVVFMLLVIIVAAVLLVRYKKSKRPHAPMTAPYVENSTFLAGVWPMYGKLDPGRSGERVAGDDSYASLEQNTYAEPSNVYGKLDSNRVTPQQTNLYAKLNSSHVDPKNMYAQLNSGQNMRNSNESHTYASLQSNGYEMPVNAESGTYAIPSPTSTGVNHAYEFSEFANGAEHAYEFTEPANDPAHVYEFHEPSTNSNDSVPGNSHVYEFEESVPSSTLYATPAPSKSPPSGSNDEEMFFGFGGAT